MTTSFPFLKIARDFGIPYGDVIRVVESWGCDRRMTYPERESYHRLCLNDALLTAIYIAVLDEADRRQGIIIT